MEQKQTIEKNRMKIAMKVADELKKGEITEEAVKNFARLMEPETLKKLSSGTPHFGTAPLPDDDW